MPSHSVPWPTTFCGIFWTCEDDPRHYHMAIFYDEDILQSSIRLSSACLTPRPLVHPGDKICTKCSEWLWNKCHLTSTNLKCIYHCNSHTICTVIAIQLATLILRNFIYYCGFSVGGNSVNRCVGRKNKITRWSLFELTPSGKCRSWFEEVGPIWWPKIPT